VQGTKAYPQCVSAGTASIRISGKTSISIGPSVCANTQSINVTWRKKRNEKENFKLGFVRLVIGLMPAISLQASCKICNHLVSNDRAKRRIILGGIAVIVIVAVLILYSSKILSW